MSGSSRGLFAWLSACLLWCVCVSSGLRGWAQGSAIPDDAYFEIYRAADPITNWPLERLLHTFPELKGLQPDDSQASLPALLRGVAQSLEVLRKDLPNTSSLEAIEESRYQDMAVTVDPSVTLSILGSLHGVAIDQGREKFRYVMLADPQSGGFREYRTDLHAHPGSPGTASNFAKTTGFVTMPLFFAGGAQALSNFRSLGSQSLGARACQVVAFAERVEPQAVRGRWQSGKNSIPLILQGIAWIDPAVHQIVRLRTDLLAPQPDARLRQLTTMVFFEPIKFQSSPTIFWLPQEVQVTVYINDYTFQNRHRYSEYQLFTVEIQQTVQKPNQPPSP
jgi:hypothetical protein